MDSNQSGFFAQIFLTFSKLTNLQWLRARQIFWMENFKSVFQQIIKTRSAPQLKVQLNQRSLIILIVLRHRYLTVSSWLSWSYLTVSPSFIVSSSEFSASKSKRALQHGNCGSWCHWLWWWWWWLCWYSLIEDDRYEDNHGDDDDNDGCHLVDWRGDTWRWTTWGPRWGSGSRRWSPCNCF